MPMRRCSGGTTPCGEDSRRPPTWMVPLSGVRKPASVRSIVVLPQPEGPSKVMNSRSAIARSTPLSAWKRAEALVDAGDVDEGHRPSPAPAASRPTSSSSPTAS